MKLFMILTRRINSYTATNRPNLQMYEWVLTGGLKYNKSFAIALIWLHCLSSLISWKEWCLWMSTTVGNVLGSFSPSYKQCITTGPNVDRKCCNFPYKRIHALVTDLCEIMVFQATGLWYRTGGCIFPFCFEASLDYCELHLQCCCHDACRKLQELI